MRKILFIIALFILSFAISCSKDGGKELNNQEEIDKYDEAKYDEAKFN